MDRRTTSALSYQAPQSTVFELSHSGTILSSSFDGGIDPTESFGDNGQLPDILFSFTFDGLL